MKKIQEMQKSIEKKEEDKQGQISLIELKAIWYDLLAQKQQIEMKMNQVNEQIVQIINGK